MATPTTARDILFSLTDRFIADSVDEDFETTFHFELSGNNGGQFSVHVEDQVCTVKEGLEGEANCVIQAKASTYEEIELGKTNAQLAFMMGKIKISNVGAMLKFIDSFERLH